jgi:diguanylate cyclase (GGDEF)-like protein/PAS domain S-box-containing protein
MNKPAPLLATAPAAAPAAALATDADGILRILLVEDLPQDADLICHALRRAGIGFITRQVDSESALREALAVFQPDIVLSDFNLPGFDGIAALEIVRAASPVLPFIFVSGMIGEDRAITVLKQGATDYVLKSNLSRLAPSVTRAIAEAANETARMQAEERLRSNESRLRDIIETTQDWIWELDADGRFTFCSGAVRRILGYEPEELIGRSFVELLHPDDEWRWPMLLPPLAEDDAAAEPAGISGVNARWLHKDGTFRWLERSAIVRQHAELLLGYRGTDRDITLRMQQETHIARLNRIHSLLSSVNAVVAKAGDRDKMLQETCRLAVERGGYLRVIIALATTPGSPSLRPLAWRSSLQDPLRTLAYSLAGAQADGSRSLAGEAMTTLQPAVCDDLRDERAVPIRHRQDLCDIGVRAMAVLPMLVDGRPIGAIVFEASESDVFDAAELELLGDIATDVGFALQYFEKDEAIQFLSRFDSLTHLAKRELFCDRLARSISATQESSAFAVLAIDLDHIGFVNDSYGREIGDQLLRATAARLKARIGDSERIAHLGGGTFAVSLFGTEAIEPGLSQARESIRGIFNDPFDVGSREIDVSVRSGLAIYPKDASGSLQLLQHAEAALRRAKEQGINDFEFTASINAQIAERMLLSQKLHRALDLNQFVIHYQPILNLDTGRIVGAEALLRWNDPERGIVMPDKFIPQLEQSGQIIQVGSWVLEQSARDRREIHAEGLGDLRFAVNISPLQLHQAEFVPHLVAIAFQDGATESRLEVEITESMLMQDLEGSIEKLKALRDLGVHISIDDFGTGYSSLALLARLPIDALKIDRSFVRNLADDPAAMTVVSTVINLARSFRLDTVAEGVETEEQLKLLRLMKCDYGQGWLFGKAVPLAELKTMLGTSPAGPQRRLI